MASKAATPELKKYMDKRVFIQLNGNRKVTGVLRGMERSAVCSGQFSV
jgi:small nuclear ribonucleoprotein G